MADDEQEPTQETPAGAKIPVPKRKDVLGDLAKVAKPAKPRQRPSDGRAGGSEE